MHKRLCDCFATDKASAGSTAKRPLGKVSFRATIFTQVGGSHLEHRLQSFPGPEFLGAPSPAGFAATRC